MAAEKDEIELSMMPDGQNRVSNDSFISEALKKHLQGLIKKHGTRMALHRALRELKPGTKEEFDYAITDNPEGMAAVRWLIEAGCDFGREKVAQKSKVTVSDMLFGKKKGETPLEIAFFSGRYRIASVICEQLEKCDQPQARNQPLPASDDSEDPTLFDVVDAALKSMSSVHDEFIHGEKLKKLLNNLTSGEECGLSEAKNDENGDKESLLEGAEGCPSVKALNLFEMLQRNDFDGNDGTKSSSSLWCALFPKSSNSSKSLLKRNTGIATEEGNAVEMNGNGRARSPSSDM